MPSKDERYMDGYLRKGYAKARAVVSKDWDWVTLIDGTEGGGKSVMAQQGAFEVDPTFDIERITFTPEDFKTAVLSAKKFQAIIYDEAYTGLSSRGTMGDINKTLVQMLAEIRQKNLFVFIVMPTFFDLDKYVALWRSRGLIHVYTDKAYGRGYFAYYNKEKKKNLYILGKKFYSYNKPSPNFRGRFLGYYVVDEEEYRKRKLKALGGHKAKSKLKEDERLPYVFKVLCNHISMKQAERELAAAGLVVSNDTIRLYIAKLQENEL